MQIRLLTVLFAFAVLWVPETEADFRDIPTERKPGDDMLDEYFAAETKKLAVRNLNQIKSKEDWDQQKQVMRRQLFEMLGLQPLPARSPLKPKITRSFEHEDIVIENLVFQSRPGLYVTANFYRPKMQDGPLPTILYVCGHGRVKIDGVSYGNKTHYQHHGTWFAKNGYTCLTIDTLQLGEIEGIHHGTHNLNRWWWNARGYTSAGVEAWNCIRALDYLETREEVDAKKIGVTGRSGGGAYSWWVSALDERIQASAPVAGIASLKNHVVDGCVEGHCDCMFMVNTYRWDFGSVAALVAPRPLLILNTDKDRIFPVDGVVDVYTQAREIYKTIGAEENIGLAFYEGPHKDTQPLRVPAFHWFERHLKGKSIDHEIEQTSAPKMFEPKELKVLDSIPENERNTAIDEYFTRRVPRRSKLPETKEDWKAQSGLILSRLRTKSFRGWPTAAIDHDLTEDARSESDGIVFTKFSFSSQKPYRLPLFLAHRSGLQVSDLELLVLNVLNEETWSGFLESVGSAFPEVFPGMELPELNAEQFQSEKQMHENQKWGMLYFPPRGIGPTAWSDDEKERIHIRRRFNLLGQTLDGMQTWDIRQAVQAIRSIEGMEKPSLWMQSSATMAGNTLYASLFEKNIERLDLHDLPASHREGPIYLNVLRYTDMPQATAIAAEKSKLRIYTDSPDDWNYLKNLAELVGWGEKQIQIRKRPSE